MGNEKRTRCLRIIKNSLMIILGSTIDAFGIDAFIKANHLALGGFSGLGLLLNYNFNIPIGAFIFIANIPLLIISWRIWGKKYVLNTLLGVIASSVAIELLSHCTMSFEDPLMPAVYGGLFAGLGIGIVMRAGGTTGGTDILAQICHKYKGISIGSFYLAFDTCVLIAVTVIHGPIITLYSLVAVFISSQVVNYVVDGLDSGRQIFIISEKPDMRGEYIKNDLHRGFTYLHGTGGYKGRERSVILCVVNRWQIFRLRQAITELDPDAFIMISSAHEVYGKGFRKPD